jgi:hypothetical protein
MDTPASPPETELDGGRAAKPLRKVLEILAATPVASKPGKAKGARKIHERAEATHHFCR